MHVLRIVAGVAISLGLAACAEVDRRNSATVTIDTSSFPGTILKFTVEGRHVCHGLLGLWFVTNDASAMMRVKGHEGDGNFPVPLSVAVIYDGNPSVHDPKFQGGFPKVSGRFPYGSSVNKTGDNGGYVKLSDQSVNFNSDACQGFSVIGQFIDPLSHSSMQTYTHLD